VTIGVGRSQERGHLGDRGYLGKNDARASTRMLRPQHLGGLTARSAEVCCRFFTASLRSQVLERLSVSTGFFARRRLIIMKWLNRLGISFFSLSARAAGPEWPS
jgi:hypothetical protein